MMELCGCCARVYSMQPSVGVCFICNNALANMDRMKKEALEILSKEKTGSFSLSTLLPKQWLVREEMLFDVRLGSRSLKSFLNQELSKWLSENSGKAYGIDGHVKLLFELRTGRVLAERMPAFVFGRYRKLVPGFSQSRWLCNDCSGRGCVRCNGKGRNYESVEELIGEPMKAEFSASSYCMHASGREDVDATNTAGRPFVMEITNPKKQAGSFDTVTNTICSGGKISVSDLKFVNRAFVEVVTESHFDKEYEVGVEFEKEPDEEGLRKILSLAGVKLRQRTPQRVAHRRSNLIRERRIIAMELTKTQDARHKTFRILAEAGTYIKELVSGDGGRTVPSFVGLLGFGARCTALNVSRIEDGFLELCRYLTSPRTSERMQHEPRHVQREDAAQVAKLSR